MELKRWTALAVAGTAWITGGILPRSPAASGASIAQDSAESILQTAEINEADANRLSIFHDYGIDAVGNTSGEIPGSTDGGLIAPYLGSWADLTGTSANRAWSVSATPFFGYDSNPQGLASARSSPFAGLDLAANAGTTITPDHDPTTLAMGFDLTGAFYRGQTKGADSIQPMVSLSILHSMFDNTIRLGGTLDDQYTEQNGTAMLNSIDLGASLEAFWLPQVSGELDYEFSHMDFYYPLIGDDTDPDTARHQISVKIHFYTLPQTVGQNIPPAPDRLTEILRRLASSATVGYGHVWNVADGHDYKYESDRVFVGFSGVHLLPSDDVSFDILLAQELQGFSSNNNEAISGPVIGGSTKGPPRHDRFDILTLRANTRLVNLSHGRGTLGTYLQWDVINDRSNTHIRGSNEYIVSTGLIYRF